MSAAGDPTGQNLSPGPGRPRARLKRNAEAGSRLKERGL